MLRILLGLYIAQDFPVNSNPVADEPRTPSLMAAGTKLLLFGS